MYLELLPSVSYTEKKEYHRGQHMTPQTNHRHAVSLPMSCAGYSGCDTGGQGGSGLGEAQAGRQGGGSPLPRLVAQHLAPPEACSLHSSSQGNYCLADPEIQGQLCFNKRGEPSTTLATAPRPQEKPRASEELAGRKLNITRGGNGSAREGHRGLRAGRGGGPTALVVGPDIRQ